MLRLNGKHMDVIARMREYDVRHGQCNILNLFF